MGQPIDFYFDFVSPYSYIATTKIDAIAADLGREVVWRPVLLVPLLDANKAARMRLQPAKYKYLAQDVARIAKRDGLRIHWPPAVEIDTLTAGRAYYWIYDRDADRAKRFALALMHAHYHEAQPMDTAERIIEIGAAQGIDAGELSAAVDEEAVKDRLRAEVDAAIAAGVFGVPFMIVDGEPFWGADRLTDMARWLENGGG